MNYEAVLAVVKEEMFDILDLPANTPFNPASRFDEYGAISIDIVTIVSCCMRRLRVRVTRDALMEAGSIGELAETFCAAQE